MNYISHLNRFFTLVKEDERLSPLHISLYMALFQYWNYNRFKNPFVVYRDNVMQLSKIGSKNTYHKCIKELHAARYIFYHPPVSKYQPVKISLLPLMVKQENDPQQLKLFTGSKKSSASIKNDTNVSTGFDTNVCPKSDTGQVPILTDMSTDNGTQHVPKVGHYIKHIQTNKLETKARAENVIEKNGDRNAGLNGVPRVPFVGHINDPPSLTDVETFFRESNYPGLEAKKFFLHYQGIGWKIHGITPIANWQAVADKWMLNAVNFNSVKNERRNERDSRTDKEYTEPL